MDADRIRVQTADKSLTIINTTFSMEKLVKNVLIDTDFHSTKCLLIDWCLVDQGSRFFIIRHIHNHTGYNQ